MAASELSALTPYIVPETLRASKIVNIGDGFILRAIERCLGRIDASRIWTSRAAPTAKVCEIMARSRGVVLAGANQLNDNFTIWPGATADLIRCRPWRFIPFAIGLHGIARMNERLADGAREQILAIHESTEFSSWRCPRTVEYLERWVPELRGRFLMTGCPVIFDGPLLEGQRFSSAERRIAVTVTERDDFWQREISTIDFVARAFPRSARWLVLHQNYEPPRNVEALRHRIGLTARSESRIVKLRRHARKQGFNVLAPASADAAILFYKTIDLHFGSRLHAHLHMLSQSKRSFLTCVDDRSLGIAEAFDFPLCDADAFEPNLGFDFERVRARARQVFHVMTRFIRSIDS